jgi:hypothetical protein
MSGRARLVRDVVAAHLLGPAPGRSHRSVRGLDNEAYEVDGDLVVRFAKDLDLGCAARLLAAVADVSLLPMPEVVFTVPRLGRLVYTSSPVHRCCTCRRPTRPQPAPRSARSAPRYTDSPVSSFTTRVVKDRIST